MGLLIGGIAGLYADPHTPHIPFAECLWAGGGSQNNDLVCVRSVPYEVSMHMYVPGLQRPLID